LTEKCSISDEQLFRDFPALRFNKGGLESAVISLAREVPVTLFVNDEEILSIATLPSNLRELFVGFLVSEGVLLRREELMECVVDISNKLVRMELDVPQERLAKIEEKGMLTSGCAGGIAFSVEASALEPPRKRAPIQVSCSTILKRMLELDTFQGTYRITRGVHAAAVADKAGTIQILEDLGRHSAVDKIVGHCFLTALPTADKLLLTTGRITSEVMTKASRGGFPVVISRSSASSLAVQMAEQLGIDVVTYVRGGRFNFFGHGAAELTED
jgi:FdhD protein